MKDHSRTLLRCAALIICFAINNLANATVFKIHSFNVQFYEEEIPYTMFIDTFSDGIPPPSAPDFTNGTPASYSTIGSPGPEYFGYRDTLDLDTSLGKLITSGVTGKELLFHRNRLLTNIDNTNPELGLTIDKEILVGSIYSLIKPEINGERYGIRMTDFGSTNTNDNVDLSVRRTSAGNVIVQFRQADFDNGEMTVLDEYPLIEDDFDSFDAIALGLYTGPYENDVYAGLILVDNSNPDNNAIHHFEVTGNIFNGENWTRAGFIASRPAVLDIDVDIKPYEQINNINPGSRGLLPVAVLTSGDFDALLVDPATVRFGPAGAIDTHGRAHVKDIDNDGDMDLLFHFRTREIGISCGDTEATLTGQTWDGTLISGTDSVNTVSCR
jgi:hypothetical protein